MMSANTEHILSAAETELSCSSHRVWAYYPHGLRIPRPFPNGYYSRYTLAFLPRVSPRSGESGAAIAQRYHAAV